ncbi:uncharacterized protein LOC131601577 [Vicia villosa]|uniref:uncharacterized protein LOC131601577 n=1 Tax=Vicia villosa TaxID=3911 RepID=UPI00273B8DDD|nr:uncharacterized protein LOC131601577 [Vicia villosa]
MDSSNTILPLLSLPKAGDFCSPRQVSELDAAATNIQKVYRSYRTRKTLADCAVIVEELWQKALEHVAATKIQKVYRSYRSRRNLEECAVLVEENWQKLLDFAALKKRSGSFFDVHSETYVQKSEK